MMVEKLWDEEDINTIASTLYKSGQLKISREANDGGSIRFDKELNQHLLLPFLDGCLRYRLQAKIIFYWSLWRSTIYCRYF